MVNTRKLTPKEEKCNMWHVLNEAAIQLGGKVERNGNVLILAGGAGSGKGFAYDMAIDFDGKKFDVDELKKKILGFKPGSALDKAFFDEYGKHLRDMDLGKGEDVRTLHEFTDLIGLDAKRKSAFFNNVSLMKEKPNVVFDVTLKERDKIVQIATLATSAGYDKRKIHIVWILNSYEVASMQNKARARKVPQSVLDATHEGVSKNFRYIFDTSTSLVDNTDGSIVNGDVWIFFNQGGVDNFVKKSGHGGMEMTTINAVRIKEAGKPMADFDTIMDMKVKEFDKDGKLVSRDKVTVGDKIRGYVPISTRGAWRRIPEDNPEEDAEYGDNTRHNL